MPHRIQTLLIANRGEIAVRVARTCRRLGVRSVAIHTDLDAAAPHVAAADDAVRVESYLDVDAVVAAAVGVGADAVHPGYGFLSERAAFAAALEAAGVTLVGPTAAVMELMGRKDAAREVAVAAGVPVVPTGDDAAYPVLVKAAAGGGGKGMRVVRSADELAEATAAARREAAAAFGDDTMLVEKYVERGRHIEVQVFGDTHGTVVHLGERDCSAQRRHQKVVEEAPAPTITPEVRALVTSSAVALAAHVGYTGAGTVEFLLDEATDEAYFLEMNTRLQVEHPVTEAVTRVRGEAVDLVELQLRVAASEPLGFTQDHVSVEGHAIEARVYAEDAYAGFLPQAGRTSLVRWPEGPDVRVDHALGPDQAVPTAYDPMLGKVIVHGADRPAAVDGLVAALEDTAILGLTTNVEFVRDLVDGAEFRGGGIDTAWLDRHPPQAPPVDDAARAAAAWVRVMVDTSGAPGPFQADGWRGGADPVPVVVELDREVVVERDRGLVDGEPFRAISAEQHVLTFVTGSAGSTGRRQAVVNAQRGYVDVVLDGRRHLFVEPDREARTAAAGDGALTAPMPGTVLDVRVGVGDDVEEGQVLGVLEAMKMELALTAPFAGTVTEVGAAAGAQVPIGAVLFAVEATS